MFYSKTVFGLKNESAGVNLKEKRS